jgi:hypothetical protein
MQHRDRAKESGLPRQAVTGRHFANGGQRLLVLG